MEIAKYANHVTFHTLSHTTQSLDRVLDLRCVAEAVVNIPGHKFHGLGIVRPISFFLCSLAVQPTLQTILQLDQWTNGLFTAIISQLCNLLPKLFNSFFQVCNSCSTRLRDLLGRLFDSLLSACYFAGIDMQRLPS